MLDLVRWAHRLTFTTVCICVNFAVSAARQCIVVLFRFKIMVLSLRDGGCLHQWNTPAVEFSTGLALDAWDNIFVCDTQQRMYVFSWTGTLLGLRLGLHVPRDVKVAIDQNSRVYVIHDTWVRCLAQATSEGVTWLPKTVDQNLSVSVLREDVQVIDNQVVFTHGYGVSVFRLCDGAVVARRMLSPQFMYFALAPVL